MRKKKLLSFLVSLVMLLGLFPTAVFAAEGTVNSGGGENLANSQRSSSGIYVLMNIPYQDFYLAELNRDVQPVDAVSSATKTKPRTGTLAGGSYHVNPDGSDISGVIYPVYVEDPSVLEGLTEITDESSVSITVINRGQETTTEYRGKDALFEAPNYAFYRLNEPPAQYKTLSGTQGSFVFSAVSGAAQTVNGVTGEVTIGARHADIEITLSGTTGIEQGDKVSGIILTDSDENKYALRHIANIWRAVEVGWNLGEFDLNGKTIKNIRYYTQDAVIDYPVEIAIGNSGYVLMNIPYNEFYAAELGEGAQLVDAVSSATKMKPRTGTLAGGSYHVNADGSDISGVIYPVFVEDMSQLEGLAQITDESSVDITVTNRGTETTTTYTGKDALFEAPDHAYYVLSEKPSRYKKLVVGEDGSLSFGAVTGRATTVEGVTGEVNSSGRHVNIEIKLTGTEGVESGDKISGIILTDAEGNNYALRHIANIWRAIEIGWNYDELPLDGKTITNIRYIKQDTVIDYPVDISIKPNPGEVTAEFKGPKYIKLTGIPDDIENPKATVQTKVGKGETATVIAENVDVKRGIITTTDVAEDGQIYSITVISDNYGDINTEALYTKPADPDAPYIPYNPDKPDSPDKPDTPDNPDVSDWPFTDVEEKPGDWVYDAVKYVYENDIMTGMTKTYFGAAETLSRGQFATILYRIANPAGVIYRQVFPDVRESDWFGLPVSWANQAGIIKGYINGYFGPADSITREQLATMLYRFAKYFGYDTSQKADFGKYPDADRVSDWARDAMQWAVGTGIIKGQNGGKYLDPQGNASRAECATMIQRFMEKYVK